MHNALFELCMVFRTLRVVRFALCFVHRALCVLSLQKVAGGEEGSAALNKLHSSDAMPYLASFFAMASVIARKASISSGLLQCRGETRTQPSIPRASSILVE